MMAHDFCLDDMLAAHNIDLDDMRFLSLSRPWPWAMFDPYARKHLEFRNWVPPPAMIGRWLAIQAAESWDARGNKIFHELGIDHFPRRYDQHPFGVIVGVVRIAGVTTDAAGSTAVPLDQRRWLGHGLGEYAWVLNAVAPIANHVERVGGQGLRRLTREQATAVVEQMP